MVHCTTGELVLVEKYPGGQSLHVGCPSRSEKVPAEHVKHEVGPGTAGPVHDDDVVVAAAKNNNRLKRIFSLACMLKTQLSCCYGFHGSLAATLFAVYL